MTLKELKNVGFEYANELGADKSASELLIMHKLGATRTELIIGEKIFPDESADALCGWLNRLAGGEPLQYIIGSAEFMSLDFKVTPDVLIPRPETELLVETLIEIFKDAAAPSFAEVGTGSGCIAVSLAKYLPKARAAAIDISPKALEIAEKNAVLNGVGDRTEFIEYDILRGFPNMNFVDCVVSNPPYIKCDIIRSLDKNVRDFEPLTALDGGEDGLDFYRRITPDAPLKKGGFLAYEIGFDQGDAVCDILRKNGFKNVRVLKDLEKRDRVVLGEKI